MPLATPPTRRHPPPLARTFYDRDVHQVARALLGKLLYRTTREGVVAGRIVETEAYRARDDTACHAHLGKRGRNCTMFGPPGRAYIYSIHSRYCLNVVVEPPETADAVLIRAIEPLLGLELMARRRQREKPRELATGPGRLCEALALDRSLDTWDLTRGRRLWIADGPGVPTTEITTAPRIGVTSAIDLPWRYFENGNLYVSGPRKYHR